MIEQLSARTDRVQWAKVIDHTRCIGCHACTTACKSENVVPIGVTRTYVKHVDVGVFPQVRRAHQVTRCNQCAHAPCVTACPTTAMFKRADGIVDFDKRICIGCKACMAACPYDAIFINPDDHSAEKCNFCAHRLDIGLEPACVVVCPTQAITVGDLGDPTSAVARTVGREAVSVRRPEKGTRPKVFYRGAHQATLDPLAARRPTGGLFMWSEQGGGPDQVTSGSPDGWGNSSAAAVLAYDVPHRVPWDWRVSLYTWTKGIAAGAWLVAVALAVPGVPLAVLAAVYTAYLFAQAKARDLWQSPLLPPHLAVQAVLAGAAALLPLDAALDAGARTELGWVLAAAALAHLLMVAGEVTLAHPTAHARLAAREMTAGRYAAWFRLGLGLVAVGLAAPLVGAWSAPLALAGLLAHEHAYVQAGQSVPLA